MSDLIEQWIINTPEDNINHCIIALHGRGGSATTMLKFLKALDIPNTMFVSLQSRYISWYPAPNGANDQYNAVTGLKVAVSELIDVIKTIKKGWMLSDNQLILLGHSAGAVLAIQTALQYKKNINSVIALAGTILEPYLVPQCKKNTHFFLQHNEDDDCFKWEERFIPMEESLTAYGYNITTSINSGQGHNSFTWNCVNDTRRFLENQLNIPPLVYDDESITDQTGTSDNQAASNP